MSAVICYAFGSLLPKFHEGYGLFLCRIAVTNVLGRPALRREGDPL